MYLAGVCEEYHSKGFIAGEIAHAEACAFKTKKGSHRLPFFGDFP
jgi:hypothetical protein